MFSLIKELYSTLSNEQRKNFLQLQALVIIMGFFEVFGIALIGPFFSLVVNNGIIESNSFVNGIYTYFKFESHYDFLFFIGVIVLSVLILSSLLSMFTVWKLATFAARVGTELADRLYIYYCKKNWIFHINTSTSDITKQLSSECTRVTDLVLNPLLLMNAKIISSIFMSIFILAYDYKIALVGLCIFLISYLSLFFIVRNRLTKNGMELSSVIGERFKLINDCFGGIKSVLVSGNESHFIKSFVNAGEIYSSSRGNNHAMSTVPRYFMELIAFGSMILLVLFFIKAKPESIDQITPLLAVYGLAAFKLLPALQQIYSSISQIKGNVFAFESIKEDLKDAKLESENEKLETSIQKINSFDVLTLSDISFSYDGKSNALSNIDISIKSNTTVGIVGHSGSGKSTLVDIILGLLEPNSGSMLAGDIIIENSNRKEWQKTIGYVPQDIFLVDGNIQDNIAFGINAKDVIPEMLDKAIKMAGLEDVINSLPEKLETKVGERGVRLSGGQKQRIGIARALYHDPSIIIFDEATSALDGITETLIMDSIKNLGKSKTIIMIAHRLKTVETCDNIFLMSSGKIECEGNYNHLLATSESFHNMVNVNTKAK
ncbi:hypothetical protein A6E05_10145 [Aliivibrio sp. 1S165]|uniref:ABC transporter ATP-binding protein n=1 Tax=unclassified Aliivibrio TaxID=2645654 RepID=UPI00080ECFB4|nr:MULTISPECIES: ABC transporter ATP-binding protein [unclassified Aliivibrio]OCH11925.1 hypothetical protein A6E05_10145 [Aliivibrio sp. 1S165]OCH35851.1 hypothetical protein A6E06_10875 [Aliivibrio sp. 1S175]